jgi:iron complex transport system ATP-binding protein
MLQLSLPALYRSRQPVLEALSLTLPRGSVLGVIGPNGAGKSTLLRALAGLAAERARLTLDDKPLPPERITLLPQSFQVCSSLSVMDCLLLGRREHLGLRVQPALLHEALALLEELDLAALANRPMERLSGGQQQRVLIAQRLFRKPALLLMDEPTSALDLRHQLAALTFLRSHARQEGMIVVAALHDLSLAARFCDRLLILQGGRVRADAPPASALSAATVRDCWQIEPEYLCDYEENLVLVPHLPAT